MSENGCRSAQFVAQALLEGVSLKWACTPIIPTGRSPDFRRTVHNRGRRLTQLPSSLRTGQVGLLIEEESQTGPAGLGRVVPVSGRPMPEPWATRCR